MSEVRPVESTPLPPRAVETHGEEAPPDAGPVRDVSTSTVTAYGAYDAGVDQMRAAFMAPAAHRPPAAVVDRFEAYFAAFADGSEIALDAVTRDGYADWVDTFGMTGRVRPSDAGHAALRVNAALHSVVDDAKRGALQPKDFGAKTWKDVPTEALLDVARQRMDDGFDVDAAVDRMQADPLWKRDPISIPTEDGMKPLDEDNAGGFMSRSIASVVAPNSWATLMLDSKFGQKVAANAKKVAETPPAAREQAALEANLSTAYALYHGHGVTRNAQAAMPAIVALTGASPIEDMKAAPAGATKASLEDLVEEGKIDGFAKTENGFVTYTVKTPQQVAAQVQAMHDLGMLDHLSVDARVELGVMLGLGDAVPGKVLADRLESEGRWSGYRQFAGGVIELALVAAATSGAGAFAEGVAVGARLSSTGIRAARFVATSASFTTLMGMKTGDLSASTYAKDALMFGVLAKAAKLAPLAAKLAPGSGLPARVGKLALAHGVAVGSTAGVLTGAQAIERMAEGDVRWRQVKADFAHNLAVVAILHGTNAGIAKLRPSLAPGAPTRAELERLTKAHGENTKATNAALGKLEVALEKGDVVAAEAAMQELAIAKDRAVATRDELRGFAHHSVGPKTGAAVDAAIGKAEQRLTGEPKLIERAEHQKRIEGDIGREGLKDLSGEIGGAKVEALHDKVKPDVVKVLAADAKTNSPVAKDLAEIPAEDAVAVEQYRTTRKGTQTPAQIVEQLKGIKGDRKRALAGKAAKARTAAADKAASEARVAALTELMRTTGFLDRADVKEALMEAKPEKVRGLLAEHVGQLEAAKRFPATEGHEVLGSVKVYELVPDSPNGPRRQGTIVVDGKVYLEVTDQDTLVLRRPPGGGKKQVVYLEQDKTGKRDKHADAVGQNEKTISAMRDLASGKRDILLLHEGRNIAPEIDVSTADAAETKTRGPNDKDFDLNVGAKQSEIVSVARALHAEGNSTP